ncbi:L-histidine N(alpha)-methyltransferase [Cupriavidus sp. AU9028]|uniref:L-histidine N(alpha)-methyltransferase n=1 Tax=Cupriavidus sp. AU9028 TaxID=2871157 RepID=UPI001C966B94|nr:L-histidine N(alpha)-methyltransferase [Cupriavidus sp. AU9028]MBY4896427.1 L-histidine N(alpha)-methyltransferase [Cupriavidus sp. AU9028]
MPGHRSTPTSPPSSNPSHATAAPAAGSPRTSNTRPPASRRTVQAAELPAPFQQANGWARPAAADTDRADAATGTLAFVQQAFPDGAAEREELVRGLLTPHAQVSPKYFYDMLGSHLFEAITELPEYYPTRTEATIFEQHALEMAERAGTGAVLIDLGAGNCAKAARLFPALRPAQYVALDISADFLRATLVGLQQQHPGLPMVGLGADLCAPLDLPPEVRAGRRLFFYPGSSIGNFDPSGARALLDRLRDAAQPGDGVLIGVDLLKDRTQLVNAYDDALGVTAAFNRNVLVHLNRVLGANFVLGDWCHVAEFDERAGCIRMYLECRRDVEVHWAGGGRAFHAGERIHTEDSYKYRREAFSALLEEAGFREPVCWTDPQGWFAIFHARV